MINPLFDISGKLALITGGGTGLGFKIAQFFVDAGARVVITGRRGQVLQDAVGQLGENAEFIVNDITRLDTLPELVSSIESRLGPIDTLINNSGAHIKKTFLDTSDEELQQIMDTNLTGVFSLTREVAGKMKSRNKGSIIMISSMAAIYGIPMVSAYTASKSAIEGLTRALAMELSPFGIRVNAIAPGFIDTPMSRKAFDADQERKQKVLARTPMNRLGTTDEIAIVALFLASDAAGYITGINMPVDGGNSIGF